jgi:hypothetical protein
LVIDSQDVSPRQMAISFTWFSILILSSSMIVFGLRNEGLFFEFALFGPIFLFCTGVVIQVFFVERKHFYSLKVDMKVSDKLNINLSHSQKYSRRLVNLLFISLFLLSTMFSIWILGRLTDGLPLLDTPSWFALCALIASVFLGLCFHRLVAHFDNVEEQSEFESLDSEMKELEHKDFVRWLILSNPSITLSKNHLKWIKEQRSSFINHINDEDDLLNSIGDMCSGNISRFEKKALQLLSPAKGSWFLNTEHFLSNNIKEYMGAKEKFHALLLFPVVAEIIRKTIHRADIKHTEVSNLFDYLSVHIGRLDYAEMPLPNNISKNSISRLKSKTDDIEFIRKLSYSSIQRGVFDWNPWWLLNLRPKMVILRNSNMWDKLNPINSTADSEILFEAISLCLTELHSESNSRINTSEMYDLIRHHMEGRKDNFSELGLLQQLCQNSPETGSKYFQLILLAWCLFGSIRDKRQLEHIDYSSKTVFELKAILKTQGKPVAGRKSDLIERLKG